MMQLGSTMIKKMIVLRRSGESTMMEDHEDDERKKKDISDWYRSWEQTKVQDEERLPP